MTKYVYCLITILFALSGNIYSQNAITGRNFDPEIMKNSYYKNGIYSDIDQFFSNSPEHEFQLSVRGNRLMYLDENNNKFRQYT
ncbi:MAG TPA: hypothetical protein VHI78_08275, partial [Bacteroidales bacterium]|nr:hypothetical protein [Bacteroidales bacterium]